ncbi:NT-type C2 domain [Dillenia turbinata]|uniref:NT-type C2 domain n=1 Tax=Dillenia turbinata TaxID=194707 RepID=A0AAN8VPY7_9MAGN
MASADQYSSSNWQNSSTTNNTQLLQELEALSQTLYQSHTASTTRRTASLVLPRNAVPSIPSADDVRSPTKNDDRPISAPRARRRSLSPWRSRPKLEEEEKVQAVTSSTNQPGSKKLEEMSAASSANKKGLWNWKPIRALSHIGMQKLSCLFSIEVVAVQGLPASMNGLRLSVCVRKQETKDRAVHTMPSRVSQGAADFEETLFIRCHVYCTPASGKQQQPKFEPRPFLIYVFAVEAGELDFGRSSVDLSNLIQESVEKSYEGSRVKQWQMSFNLSGKAKGGELVLKLGFQIMEKDGGIGIYSRPEGAKSSKDRTYSSSYARKQSKSSFNVPSPQMSSRAEAWTPSQTGVSVDFQGIDDLNLDEPAPVTSNSHSVQKSEEPESKVDDLELPDFDVVDKGVEIQDSKGGGGEESEGNTDEKSVPSEVVKEIVHDPVHLTRLTELDSIAQQIKALESMMADEKLVQVEETESNGLDAEEETITREFLQLLEDEETGQFKPNQEISIPSFRLDGNEEYAEGETQVYLPDLGKGLGCVVQTRNGGYLAAMNPLDTKMARKDAPKMAMQLSKPLILSSKKSISGFELFQSMAAIGLEELSSKILCSMPIDELIGKTAEQIAFEGIASAIIHGRNKEGASSSAARTIAAVKNMVTAMNAGRKERISTGLWNINEEPLPVDELLAFSMQKIESMAVEALKIQAEIAEEDAPFDVSAVTGKTDGKDPDHILASTVPLEEWLKKSKSETVKSETDEPATITISVVIQLRDPLRLYEAVGGPMIALIQATQVEGKISKYDGEEEKYRVASMHVGGLKVRSGGKRNAWDTEKQRLTAMQWLVAYGLGKAAGKKAKHSASSKGRQDMLWSISSRVMADMWLKPMRNPDVKFSK